MSAEMLAKEATPAQAAAFWFNRQRSGDMTTGELRAFEVWLERDPAHKAAFKAVERTWGFFGAIEDEPAIIDMRERDETVLDRRERTQRFGAIAAGVGFVLAVGGGVAAVQSDLIERAGWFAPAPVKEFRTAVGERKRVMLEDGSAVTLDTDTVLRAQITGGKRRVMLERGQASFEVAKERGRPFIVAAAGMSVRAVGTVFDVRAEPGRFEVTLIEGRVRVQEQGREREDAPMANMRPGWRLAIGEDARWRMEPVDLVRETAWHEGMLYFYEDPLEDAAAEMNRYSHRKVVFVGEVPETFIMGRFHVGDVDNFVRAIEMNKLARVVSKTDERVEIAAR